MPEDGGRREKQKAPEGLAFQDESEAFPGSAVPEEASAFHPQRTLHDRPEENRASLSGRAKGRANEKWEGR